MNLQATAKEEPPINGKVVITTSHGDLQIQLWSREAPLACRSFVQHCLDGYYNNTIFHRLIPSFMIQGGDPTGTGTGGEGAFDELFRDQFHQRLKFVRRGIVAMANTGKNSNGSQFFITFGECQHLNKKHTIFGRMTGDTIYNLMAMQSLDTDQNDRPIDPPVIRRTRVLLNPFDDVQPRKNSKQNQPTNAVDSVQQQEIKANESVRKKEEIKKLKNKKKLTFELQQGEGERVISSHDVLEDYNLSREVALKADQLVRRREQREEEQRKAIQAKEKILGRGQQQKNLQQLLREQAQKKRRLNQSVQGNVKDEVLNYKTKLNRQTGRMEMVWGQDAIQEKAEEEEEEIADEKLRNIRVLQKQQFQKLLADELNFKKIKEGSQREKRKMKLGQEMQLLSNAQKMRYEFLKKQELGKVQNNLFDKLNQFTSKLRNPSTQNWMNHKLKFHIDSDNAFRLDEKKRVLHEDQEDLDDGGLKIQYEKLDPTDKEFNVDQIYDLLHKEE